MSNDAATDNRSQVKEQSFLHSFHYWPTTLWAVLQSSDSTKHKFKHVAQFMVVSLQCRNPNQQSKRIVVATVHCAGGLNPSPDEAYNDVVLFTEAMKSARDSHRGPQSLKVFPADPVDFVARYPSAYDMMDGPVPSKIDKHVIMARSTKEVTPLRSGNKKLTRAQSSSSVASPGFPMQDMWNSQMNPMMQMMARTWMQSFMHSGDPRQSGANLTIFQDTPISPSDRGNFQMPASAGSQDSSPGALEDNIQSTASPSHAGGFGDQVPGCLAIKKRAPSTSLALLQSATMAKIHKAQMSMSMGCESGDDGEDAGDDSPVPIDKPSASTVVVIKKPAASTVVVIKKPATSPDVIKKPATSPAASTVVQTSLQRVNKDIGDSPSVPDIIISGQSIFKYPQAVTTLQAQMAPDNRPAPTKDAIKYNGGKIYFADKGLRVVKRIGDRIDQLIPMDWGNTKSKKDGWALACAIIETDPRAC